MNYKIIKDEEELKKFINWLPDLQEHEVYYVCLFARSKYTRDEAGINSIPHIKTDKAQLKRFTSKKEDLIYKIKQLECPIGSYVQKHGEIVVPQEALALYITPNPRSMYKAAFESMKQLIRCIENTSKNFNPHQEVISEIQKAKSYSHVVDFDIDSKETSSSDILKYASEVVNPEAITLIETRGGYHLLIHPDKVKYEYKNNWYNTLVKWNNVDQAGDNMIPVPGCTQGNFIPKIIK